MNIIVVCNKCTFVNKNASSCVVEQFFLSCLKVSCAENYHYGVNVNFETQSLCTSKLDLN
jgi:hypothetical protein